MPSRGIHGEFWPQMSDFSVKLSTSLEQNHCPISEMEASLSKQGSEATGDPPWARLCQELGSLGQVQMDEVLPGLGISVSWRYLKSQQVSIEN